MEELLDEQARFFASNNLPAAAVTRRRDPSENVPSTASAESKPVRPLSKFAASREKRAAAAESHEAGPRVFAKPYKVTL
jgi:hypothetical protein